MDMEWRENRTVAVRVRRVTIDEPKDETVNGLKTKIESLTTILKSITLGNNKQKGGERGEPGKVTIKGNKGKSKSIPITSVKGKDPSTSAAGPIKICQKPIQHYSCGGWGHRWCECPSKGNRSWRELNKAAIPLVLESIGPNPHENKE